MSATATATWSRRRIIAAEPARRPRPDRRDEVGQQRRGRRRCPGRRRRPCPRSAATARPRCRIGPTTRAARAPSPSRAVTADVIPPLAITTPARTSRATCASAVAIRRWLAGIDQRGVAHALGRDHRQPVRARCARRAACGEPLDLLLAPVAGQRAHVGRDRRPGTRALERLELRGRRRARTSRTPRARRGRRGGSATGASRPCR